MDETSVFDGEGLGALREGETADQLIDRALVVANDVLRRQKERVMAFDHKDFGVLRVAVNGDGDVMFCLEDVARALGIIVEEAAGIVGQENIDTVEIEAISADDFDFGGDVE